MGDKPVERKKILRHFRDLEVYQVAFTGAMDLFHLTKNFPADEKYSLVDQIRRSSKSVCSNLDEVVKSQKSHKMSF